MMMNKIKNYKLYGLLSLVGVVGISLAIILSTSNNFKTSITNADSSYSLVLSKDKNQLETASEMSDSTFTTQLGSTIGISYFGYTAGGDSSWGTMAGEKDGMLANTTPIHGLKSVNLAISYSGSLDMYIYWGNTVFCTQNFEYFSSGTSIYCDFSNMAPSYFGFAFDTYCDDVTIISATFSFACEIGSSYYLGMYPQSKVTDNDLIDTLTTKVGDVPTKDNFNSWTSYEYYISNSKSTPFMWYKDASYYQYRYRAVYFNEYRPSSTFHSSTYNNQSSFGYIKNHIYFFKYEPIKWDVLEVAADKSKAFVVSSISLDAQEFNYVDDLVDAPKPNNYQYSYINYWLNGNNDAVISNSYSFINSAFDSDEKDLIIESEVKNILTTSVTPNTYACDNFNTKMFLLSYEDVTNTNYGFASTSTASSTRQKQVSDYGVCQGAYVSSQFNNSSGWATRSPGSLNSTYFSYIDEEGTI